MTWTFAYDPLMGDHRLRAHDAQPALLAGYHRAFNHRSTLLWGDETNPCPLLGLSAGGECWGIACRVEGRERRDLLRRLKPAECAAQLRRISAPVRLRDGATHQALVWVSRREFAAHPVADGETDRHVFTRAHGTAGRGVEYVRGVVHALGLWHLDDPLIDAIWRRLETWRPR